MLVIKTLLVALLCFKLNPQLSRPLDVSLAQEVTGKAPGNDNDGSVKWRRELSGGGDEGDSALLRCQ